MDSKTRRAIRKHCESCGNITRGPSLGVPTGGITGFDVLDIDRRHGGDVWFLENSDRLLPTRTRWHKTRGGGLHLFFQDVPGARCSAGKIARRVDVRTTGQIYSVNPPKGALSKRTKNPSSAHGPGKIRRLNNHHASNLIGLGVRALP
jgi:hypothetical protein